MQRAGTAAAHFLSIRAPRRPPRRKGVRANQKTMSPIPSFNSGAPDFRVLPRHGKGYSMIQFGKGPMQLAAAAPGSPFAAKAANDVAVDLRLVDGAYPLRACR
jgi:hypothetical protein